jgi:hypothetical protein
MARAPATHVDEERLLEAIAASGQDRRLLGRDWKDELRARAD